MSLSAREQQALDSIEDEMAGSDPKLASLLATFARLASGEEMPVREKSQVLQRHATRRPHGGSSRRRFLCSHMIDRRLRPVDLVPCSAPRR